MNKGRIFALAIALFAIVILAQIWRTGPALKPNAVSQAAAPAQPTQAVPASMPAAPSGEAAEAEAAPPAAAEPAPAEAQPAQPQQ